MQDIRQETLNECTRAEQSASVVLWEIDLTEVGGERYFFCNEQNEKGEPVTFFVLLITEKITFSTDLCQVDFPEHHADGF